MSDKENQVEEPENVSGEDISETQPEAETKPAKKTTKTKAAKEDKTPEVAEEPAAEVAEESKAVEEPVVEVTEEPAAEVVEEPVAEVKEEPAVEEEKPAKATKKAAPKVEAEEEFNWEAFETKGLGEGYTAKQKEEMAKMYEGTLTTIEEKQVISGTIVGLNERDVIVNIGFKSDGLVSLSEFRDTPGLKVGDTVEIYIEEQEDANGQLILSRRKSQNC